MVLQDLQQILEARAPREIAWERDNVGVQTGSNQQRVRSILVTLDVTDAVINEAIRKKISVIISHHPLIFQPIKTLNANTRTGRLLTKLLASKIALYVMHTNLDFTEEGVSFSLATQLQLHQTEVLHQHYQIQKKIVVYVPEEHAEQLIHAMSAQGAGIIGNYEYCSFRTQGVGTFKPRKGAQPFKGKIGRLETASEVRLEMIAPAWNVQNVLQAMRDVHPFEEVAYEIYDLANSSKNLGAGAIGVLKRSQTLTSFLAHVRHCLHVPSLRFAAGLRKTIRRVAVCGGSGSDLISIAIQRGADAFVTADLTYHKFQDCDNRIVLIDAGHYETEIPLVKHLVEYLKSELAARKEKVLVLPSNVKSNFVQYSLA